MNVISLTVTDHNVQAKACYCYIYSHDYAEGVRYTSPSLRIIIIKTTSRRSVTATTSTTLAHAKRAITPAIDQRHNDIPLPSYLSGFASSAISTACSCLSIVASTTTVKTTYTVVGSASTVVVQKTLTAAPVTTTVSTVTVKVTASSTVSTSSTRPVCANALPTVRAVSILSLFTSFRSCRRLLEA